LRICASRSWETAGSPLEKIAVAAVFHDLGIWNNTFDYIAPSVEITRKYLTVRGLGDWIPAIEAMILDHHKITP